VSANARSGSRYRKAQTLSTGRKPTIAIVDDERSVCDALAETLALAGVRPTCFIDPARFLSEYDPDRFDCLVLDVRMPGLSGLEVQQELNRRAGDLPVIFISGHGDIPMAMAAARAGALHFLEKPFRDQVLLEAVGEAIAVGNRRRAKRSRHEQLRARVRGLTARERQVAEAVTAGQRARAIAARLGLSPRTVEMHKARAMRRLGVSTSTALTRVMIEAEAAGTEADATDIPTSSPPRPRALLSRARARCPH
jgi:FixJ family two-component response regulator